MAQFDITLVSVLWGIFTLAAVALALLITQARDDTWRNRALVALLLQQAAATALSVVLLTTRDPVLVEPAFRLLAPIWLLWPPIIFLCGPMLLGKSADRLAWAIGLAGAIPILALVAVGIIRQDLLVLAGDGLLQLTPLATNAQLLAFVAFAVTTGLLAHEALTTELPTRQAQFGLLAAAFSVEGAYHAAGNATKLLLGLDFHGLAEADRVLSGIGLAPAVLYVGLAAYLVIAILRGRREGHRFWATALLGAIVASAVSGIGASGLSVADTMREPLGAFHAVWDLVAIGLIVFAGLRYQLFNIERHAKRGVVLMAGLGGGFVVFNVVQEVAEGFLAETVLFGNLPAPGIVAAVAVGVGAIPLEKLGQKVASRVFPQDTDSPAYRDQRSIELYQAALEGALADGIQDPGEAATLRALREQLDIDMATHKRLLAEIHALLDEEAAGDDETGGDPQDGAQPPGHPPEDPPEELTVAR